MGEAIPFFRHDLGDAEVRAFELALMDPTMASGHTLARFERDFAIASGRRHAIATTNLTAAIQLSLLALDVGRGDEVITSPLVAPETLSAMLLAGARPVFVDVEPDTGNIDPSNVVTAITSRTRAVIATHLYGQMADVVTLAETAASRRIRLIEDASECLEGGRDGVLPGDLGDTVCFSFAATSSISSGDGGAVATDNDGVAEKLRSFQRHGHLPAAARMDDLRAAILLPQLARIGDNWLRRTAIAKGYEHALSRISHIWWPRTRPQVRHARHAFPVWITFDRRDDVARALTARGIGIDTHYAPLHLLPSIRRTFGYRTGQFPAAERIALSCLALPLHPRLTSDDVQVTARVIASVLGKLSEPRDLPTAS